MAEFQGPTRPGTNKKVFRETGVSTPSFQGPVRPGTDEERFRRTGSSGGGGGGGRGGGDDGSAERARLAELARKAATEAARKKAAQEAAAKKIKDLLADKKFKLLSKAARARIKEQLQRNIVRGGLLTPAELARERIRIKKEISGGDKPTNKAGDFISSALLGPQRSFVIKSKPKPTKPKRSFFERITTPKQPTKFEDLSLKKQRQSLKRREQKKKTRQFISNLNKKGISLLRKVGVKEPVLEFLEKPAPPIVGSLAKDIFFLPAFAGGSARIGQQAIRKAFIKQGIKNPKIRFKSAIQPNGVTGTVALTEVAEKKILTVLKTKPLGSKFNIGKGVSAVKTKGSFKFINTNVGSASTRLKGTATKTKIDPIKRKFKVGRNTVRIKGKVQLRQKLKDADIFASINLERELAKQNVFVKQKKLTVLKKAKFFRGSTKVKPKPTKKTALLGTIQRKGKTLFIQAGKGQLKKSGRGKLRFKSTIRGTADFIPSVEQKRIVIQAGNQLRRQELVQLKQSLQQAGVTIPQNLQSTIKQVTDKVFKTELAKLKVITKTTKPRTILTSIRQAPSSSQAVRSKSRIAQVPVSKPRDKQKQRQPVKTLSRTIGRTKQRGRQVVRTGQRVAQKPKQQQRSRLVLKTRLQQRQRTRQRSPPFTTPRLRPPRNIPLPLFAFLLKNNLIRKKKKKKGKTGKDDLVLVEGFTAKALRLKPVRIKAKDIRKFAKRFQTVGTRRRPVIVRSKVRRRKKR